MINNKNNDIQIKCMKSQHETIPDFTGIPVPRGPFSEDWSNP